ncbi:ABC transporter ATP-binding protein [Streptomyces sp. NPDC001903]|uniref:ABC transporter ATP-binding protein n=1 Tax=Streptomyces sp. NPDC001903 TaxID=3364622 RepID=UPI0036CD19F9
MTAAGSRREHPAIELHGVGRIYAEAGRRHTALEDVSLTVARGEVVGLLGENGAGKTTLTKILATLLLPSTGTARVMGADVVRDPTAVRAVQSVVFGGDRGLYTRLSGRENLRFFGMLDGLPHRQLTARLEPALAEVGLAEAADRKVSAYSKGMRQRLHIAIGMISRPQVLLLDEPTVGLDPLEAARLRSAVGALRADGVTVLLTSHHLLDIEELADRVVLLERGRITRDMSVAAFAALLGYVATVVVHGTGPAPATQTLDALDTVSPSVLHRPADRPDAWRLELRLARWSPRLLGTLGQALADTTLTGMDVQPARLEDAYLHHHTARGPR